MFCGGYYASNDRRDAYIGGFKDKVIAV